MAIDSTTWDTRLVTTNSSSVTLNYSTSFTNLITSNSFTLGTISPIKLSLNLIHQYEQGATNVAYRFQLINASGTVVAGSNEMQVSKQGFGSNASFGAHNMHWTFYNSGAGTYTARVQGRNIGNSGTQAITTYFSPNTQLNDQFVITYQA